VLSKERSPTKQRTMAKYDDGNKFSCILQGEGSCGACWAPAVSVGCRGVDAKAGGHTWCTLLQNSLCVMVQGRWWWPWKAAICLPSTGVLPSPAFSTYTHQSRKSCCRTQMHARTHARTHTHPFIAINTWNLPHQNCSLARCEPSYLAWYVAGAQVARHRPAAAQKQ